MVPDNEPYNLQIEDYVDIHKFNLLFALDMLLKIYLRNAANFGW